MWLAQRSLIIRIAKYFFQMGLKRQYTLSDEALEKEVDDWIDKNLVH